MKREILFIVLMLVILSISMSGCEEKKNEKNTMISDRISFYGGGIFDLVEGKFDFIKNKDSIVGVRVIMRFKNIENETVNANVSVEFYDKDNNLIYKTLKQFINYPPGYVDSPITDEDLNKPTPNIVIYNGNNSKDIDHVVIRVTKLI